MIRRQQAQLFYNWAKITTDEEKASIARELVALVLSMESGKDSHARCLAWFQGRVGWQLPYYSAQIADRFERLKEKALNDGVEFPGLPTMIFLLQCPLRDVDGKMIGSYTGCFHKRIDITFNKGLVNACNLIYRTSYERASIPAIITTRSSHAQCIALLSLDRW